MGNSDSTSNKNIIKKKVKSNINNKIKKNNQINQNNIVYNNERQNYERQNYERQNYERQNYEKQYHIPQHEYVDKNNDFINYDNHEKMLNRQNNNNAIMERNVLNDVYNRSYTNQNNNLFDYPINSNNQLSVPKPSFDNLEFTPYNFNENVTKFKKSIEDDSHEFEKNEIERRKNFENNQQKKKEFLENVIKDFEYNYNPWEILGLQHGDYDINNIKKAYKKSALKYHPDRAGKKYEDKFQLITQSYIYLLNKVENENINIKKMNKKVEKADYVDNINDGVENIYVDKDKFDINNFNKIFEKYKVPDTFDSGYGDLMKQELKNNNDENYIFGNNFNHDIFNAHFDNLKNKKKSNAIIEYNEPNALDSSNGNNNLLFLGVNNIDDFGSMNNNNLSYTDYKKAHVDETLLINPNNVKIKNYKSVDDYENERAKLSYNASFNDKKNYEYLEKKKLEDENLRLAQIKNYDNMIQKQYNKLNRKLIVHK